MKKNKLFTFLTMFFLMTILSTSVFAFDTDNAGPSTWSSAATGDWGFNTFTGTRYIFRIECEDGVYRDIGYNNEVVGEIYGKEVENKSALYYINHFQRVSKVEGLTSATNNTESNENYCRVSTKDYDKKTDLIESVFMGSSLLGYTQVFKGAKANGYSYFDTNVSSTKTYDESSYRHVTVWCRIDKGGSVYTDNFNLSVSDIEKLANTVKSYAKKNNDDITLAQINDIINGEKAYQIRAEILLRVHSATGQVRRCEDKDISAIVKGKSPCTLLTFREMMALRGGSEFGPFSEIAALLFEKDKPWYDEYSDAYSFLNGSYQGKDFRYIGWDYIQINEDPFRKIEVKVIGVDEKTNKVIYSKDVDGNDISSDKIPKLDLPLKDFVIKESKYSPSGYKYLNEYEVEYGTSTFTGKGETSKGGRLTLNIDKSINAPRQVLIVFYYNADNTVKVQHIYVDPMTSGETLLDTQEIGIDLNVKKELSSIVPSGDYINFKYEGIYIKDGEKNVIEDISGENFKKYSVTNLNNLYTLTFTPTEEDGEYIINFYYTSQIITVKHEYESGDPIKNPVTKILDPSEEEDSLGGYELKEYTLNGDPQTDSLPIKVSLKEGEPSQELIFIYYPQDKGSNEKPDPEPDPEPTPGYGKLTIEPSNLNNQLINQDDKKYYWVLNENGKVTIKLEVENMDSETEKIECKLKIPFDVYINGTYKKATSEIKVALDAKVDLGHYEGTVENIYVPVWVTENTENTEYTLKATLSSDDSVNGEANVTVVGAVYDFTITNLDGSDVTGDSIWKNALFGKSNDGYKAKNTPIGQGGAQQPQKYYEAIKRGTRFYFSLNTLGAANKSIVINPSFYYVSNDGKKVTPVNMESKYKGNTRGISLTDANRVTEEFTKERKMKSTLGGTLATNANIGDYDVITLGSDVSTPYLGIVNDVKAKFGSKEISAILQGTGKDDKALYKVANHWYGDYSIPNDAEFYYANTTTKVDDENGYIVVYFSIKTRTESKDYLAYNLASPFVQTRKISEWIYERQENKVNVNLNNTLTLPKTNVSSSDDTTVNSAWIKDINTASGKTATIIYSLKPNVSTKQNVTSVGTH